MEFSLQSESLAAQPLSEIRYMPGEIAEFEESLASLQPVHEIPSATTAVPTPIQPDSVGIPSSSRISQSTSRPNRTTNQLQFIAGVVKTLLDHPWNWPFRRPVDWKKLELFNYPEIVTHPMFVPYADRKLLLLFHQIYSIKEVVLKLTLDSGLYPFRDLSTVRRKLTQCVYWNAAEGIADIRLIFSNCYAFNKPDDCDVVTMARKLEEIFEEKLSAMPEPEIEIELPKKTKNKQSVPTKADTPSTHSKRRLSTRSARIDVINELAPHKRRPSKMNDRMRFCHTLMRELLHKKHQSFAWPFRDQVEPDSFDPPLDDYFDLIVTPMDLTTVKRKLKRMEYADADNFVADVYLIFRNCYSYNPPDHEIVGMCMQLHEVFERLVMRMPKRKEGAGLDSEYKEEPPAPVLDSAELVLPFSQDLQAATSDDNAILEESACTEPLSKHDRVSQQHSVKASREVSVAVNPHDESHKEHRQGESQVSLTSAARRKKSKMDIPHQPRQNDSFGHIVGAIGVGVADDGKDVNTSSDNSTTSSSSDSDSDGYDSDVEKAEIIQQKLLLLRQELSAVKKNGRRKQRKNSKAPSVPPSSKPAAGRLGKKRKRDSVSGDISAKNVRKPATISASAQLSQDLLVLEADQQREALGLIQMMETSLPEEIEIDSAGDWIQNYGLSSRTISSLQDFLTRCHEKGRNRKALESRDAFDALRF